jgi:muramoyltetrapeptide carboxypeptidase
MAKPRAVRQGDRIAVVAPASPFPREELDKGVAELRRLGYEPVYDESLFAHDRGYLAGSARVRADAFIRYWTDPSVAALIAVRGGFGSVHILPQLEKAGIGRYPKLFIGYSDTTSIMSWLTCHCHIPTLHGPMLERRLALGMVGYDSRSFTALLRGEGTLRLEPEGVAVLRGGEAAGPLFGGTMAQLIASLGTPYAFAPPEGCILFLEDVNERPYRIDRMLTQLWLSGVLPRARALVFGEMRGCEESGGAPAVRDVIDAVTQEFQGPVIMGFPSGHTTGPCWTLPLGVPVRVVTSPSPAVIVLESPVTGAR